MRERERERERERGERQREEREREESFFTFMKYLKNIFSYFQLFPRYVFLL
jgi:hypothetical protein